MSTEVVDSQTTVRKLWLRNGAIWVVLLGLLLLSLVLAYVPMGRVTVAAGIVIALIKSTLVMLLFMEILRSKSLIRLVAVTGWSS